MYWMEMVRHRFYTRLFLTVLVCGFPVETG